MQEIDVGDLEKAPEGGGPGSREEILLHEIIEQHLNKINPKVRDKFNTFHPMAIKLEPTFNGGWVREHVKKQRPEINNDGTKTLKTIYTKGDRIVRVYTVFDNNGKVIRVDRTGY